MVTSGRVSRQHCRYRCGLCAVAVPLREVNCLMLCNEEHALSTHPRQLTNHTSGFGSTGKVKTHAPKALYLMLAAALDAIYCGCCVRARCGAERAEVIRW